MCYFPDCSQSAWLVAFWRSSGFVVIITSLQWWKCVGKGSNAESLKKDSSMNIIICVALWGCQVILHSWLLYSVQMEKQCQILSLKMKNDDLPACKTPDLPWLVSKLTDGCQNRLRLVFRWSCEFLAIVANSSRRCYISKNNINCMD